MKVSATAPEMSRMEVKLAASISEYLSARRHSSELPAKQSIARIVRLKRRAGFRATRRLVEQLDGVAFSHDAFHDDVAVDTRGAFVSLRDLF